MSLQLNSVARFSSPIRRCRLLKPRLREIMAAAYLKDQGGMELNSYWQKILLSYIKTKNELACAEFEQEEVGQGLEKVRRCRNSEST